jgi:hypothetical protein
MEDTSVKRQPVMADGAGETAAVQLGAFTTEAATFAAWTKIVAASQDALRGLKPIAEPVDVPAKGRLWRLKATVADKAAARRLCQDLTRRKLVCVLAKA